MSDPIPVTTRIITAESGSSRSVKVTAKSPELIQVNTCWAMARASAGNAISLKTETSDTRNDAIIAPHAIAPEAGLLTRRPKLAFSRNPTSGRSGISSSMRASPLQRRKRIGVERLAVTEQPDHNRQPDRGFGGRDGHHEEHDDLPVRGAERAAERHKRQIHRVQHDLDRQQHRDDVAAHEHAGRPNREEHGGENQVVDEGRRRHHGFPGLRGLLGSRRARTTAPTMATRMRTEVTSN